MLLIFAPVSKYISVALSFGLQMLCTIVVYKIVNVGSFQRTILYDFN